MNWPGPVLTDSGGYQIFSLPHSREVTEEGARFQSYVDGRTVRLSPELSIETQVAIGSDIMMVLDHCVSAVADRATARAALDLTHRWAVRCLDARGDSPQSLFGIVQGALFADLRRESVERLSGMPFDGLAIGGLAVGEGREERQDVCEQTAERMPRDRPRYLMGVGTPLDLLEAVHRGLDMFDCILPTALGERGGVFTSRGYLQLRRGIHKHADEALDPGCSCPTCRHHSRAYLHHLTKTDEALGWHLLGQHNLHFYHRLMREIRQSILDDTFASLYAQKRRQLEERDLDNPSTPPRSRSRPARPPALGGYEVHLAREGFASIRHVASGEVMHARTPPMVEAESLYVDQSELAQRLALGPAESASDATPLVLWDVGLGAGELFGFGAAFFAAVSANVIRGMRGTDNAPTIFFYFCLAGLPVVAPFALDPWTARPGAWLLAVVMGLCAFAAQVLMTEAYGALAVSEAAIWLQLTPIAQAALAVPLLGERLAPLALLGVLVGVAGVAWGTVLGHRPPPGGRPAPVPSEPPP